MVQIRFKLGNSYEEVNILAKNTKRQRTEDEDKRMKVGNERWMMLSG